MDESGKDPGSVQPQASALRYMTVPEKIELSSGGARGGYPASGGGAGGVMDQAGGYRPMKVPDTITLEPTAAPSVANVPSADVVEQPKVGLWRTESGEPVSQVQQPELPKQPHEPPNFQEGYHPAIVELDRRVKTLEQQVQRLKNVAVSRDSQAGQVRQGNNFWYVLTFAGWMMVPLIVAYMHRYRR